MGANAERMRMRDQARRYNAAKRQADKLEREGTPRLILVNTVSEVERYTVASDAGRAAEYNREVEEWAARTSAKLRAKVSQRSRRVAQGLLPNFYRDRYGLVDRIGFSFPRHGIYLHRGAGRGYGGEKGSKWYKSKRVNGVEIQTSVLRHTNPASLHKMGRGRRTPFAWFDPVVSRELKELEEIVLRYFSGVAVDATNIYIDR